MKRIYTRLLQLLTVVMFFASPHSAEARPCNNTAAWSYVNPLRDSVVFTSADTNSLVQHIWIFGDGSIDTVSGTTVSHVYATGGSYQVCQYVQYIGGACPDTLCQSITVYDTCHITAAWTYVRLGGDSMRFTAADTNSAATHLWKFSDGGFAFGSTQTVHHFAVPGVYTACFYVYHGACEDSLCQSVTVSSDTCGLLATWTWNNLVNDTVTFFAGNTDTSLIRTWNFGDGAYATGTIDTTHVYASSGFFTACLYLHKPGTNCYDTLCQSISVGSNPCGITNFYTYSAYSGDSVQFFSSDTNSHSHYQWNFGDGSFVTGVRNTSHHYTSSGVYHVCLYTYIPGTSCSDSICQDVTVSLDTCGLSAVWHAVNLGGDSLRFIASDTTSGATYVWSFGDGSRAAGSSDTVHQYASGGTYTICLRVSYPTGCTDSICQSILVGAPPCPVTAAWTAYPLGGDSIRFEAADTVTSATHIWNFGDGTYAYGTTSITHTFASAASYRVCFYAYVLGTTCSDSLCQYVSIATDTCHITSYWTASVLGGDSARFSAADTNSTAHHVWNFGDGSSADTMQTNHVYGAPGTYHVCLYVYKTGTACSDSLCQDVTITAPAPCNITAAWSATVIGNDSIRFSAADTNHAAQHNWKFGDGTTASGTSSTIHHYASAGNYQVCFYVSIPGTNCSDSVCQNVNVTGSVPCGITAAWTSAIVGNDSVSFTVSDTNRAAHHIWNFGDGTVLTGVKDTIHHYASAGVYTVCFYTYITGTSCSDTVCQSVVVTGSSPCHVNPAWTYHSTLGTDSARFYAADTNSTAIYRWTFGDGSSATGARDTFHHYALPGSYTVCLHITIPGTSCSDSLCQFITVLDTTPCNITAAWTFHSFTGDSVSFTASDTNSTAHHAWNLGDGTIVSNVTNLTHTYASPGAYRVCFYVYIPGTNCSDSLCQMVNAVLGINDLTESLPAITVMPNPFGQYTLIKVDGNVEPYEMNVYDLVGKLMRHEMSADNTFNFDRGNLSSGMYMYEVILKGNTVGKGKIIAE